MSVSQGDRYHHVMSNLLDLRRSHQSSVIQRFLSHLWIPLRWERIKDSMRVTYNDENSITLEEWINDAVLKGHLSQSKWLNGKDPYTEEYFKMTVGLLSQIASLLIDAKRLNFAFSDLSVKNVYIVDGCIKYRGYGLKTFTDEYGDDKAMVYDFGRVIAHSLYGAKLTHHSVDWGFVDYLPSFVREAVDSNPFYRPYLDKFGDSLMKRWQEDIAYDLSVVKDARIMTREEKRARDAADRQRSRSLQSERDGDFDLPVYDDPDSSTNGGPIGPGVQESSTLEPEEGSNDQHEEPGAKDVDESSPRFALLENKEKYDTTEYTMTLLGNTGFVELEDTRLEHVIGAEFTESNEDTAMFVFDEDNDEKNVNVNVEGVGMDDVYTAAILDLDLDFGAAADGEDSDGCFEFE